MTPITLHQLNCFLKILDAGSFTKAAAEIGIAQPALSLHINKLEHLMQVQLLERSSKGAVATAAGEKLREHAITILRQTEQAVMDVRNQEDDLSGTVSIAMPFAASQLFIVPLLKATKEKYPGINIVIRESMSLKISDIVTGGHADLALLPNGHRIRGLATETLLSEHLFFGGLRDENFSDDAPIPLAEVCKYPLVLPFRPNSSRITLEQAALDNGYSLDVRAEQDTGRMINHLVEAGLGYSVMSWSAFYKKWQEGTFFAKKIIDPELPRQFTVAWPKSKTLTPRILAIKDELRTILHDLHAQAVLVGDFR